MVKLSKTRQSIVVLAASCCMGCISWGTPAEVQAHSLSSKDDDTDLHSASTVYLRKDTKDKTQEIKGDWPFPFWNPNLPTPERVNDLVERLTLEEKVQQMSYGGANLNGPAPAIPRLEIKPYQWGTECLTGDVEPPTGPSTAFGQALGLAASFNRVLLYDVARAISDEVRAKHNNYSANHEYMFHSGLSCWSPVINIFRQPLWGRGQETYGEDTVLTSVLAKAYVTGLQGNNSRYVEAIAGCKHFDAYAGPEDIPSSRFSFSANVSTRDWRMTFLPAFQACVEANVQSVMCSYNAINGIPACAHQYMITDVLRKEWGFDGYVVSDQGAIEMIDVGITLHGHHYAEDWLHAAVDAVSAGVDLEDANFHDVILFRNAFTYLSDAVNQGLLNVSYLDASVKRLFTARMRLGEFDPVSMNPYNRLNVNSSVDTPHHRSLARESAREMQVLLKNQPITSGSGEPILPLSVSSLKSQHSRIQLFGPQGNSSNSLFGDYAPAPSFVVTPVQGIFSIFSKGYDQNSNPTNPKFATWKNGTGSSSTELGDANSTISFTQGCDSVYCSFYDNASVINASRNADVAVLFMGLSQDIEAEGHDRSTVELPGHQMQMIQDVANNVPEGTPVILYIFTCGPVDVTWAQNIDNVHAIVQGFYPAQSTGDAVSDILFGNTDAGGRLPVTWPTNMSQVLPMSNYSMSGRTYRYWFDDSSQSSPLYPFGYGLSFTEWKYLSLDISKSQVSPCEQITGSITFINAGSFKGDEVAQIYVRWGNDQLPVPDVQLVNFTRVVGVNPGEQSVFDFTISPRDLGFYANVSDSSPAGKDYGGYWETANGTLTIYAGGQQPDFNGRVKPRVPSNVLKQTVNIVGERRPLSHC
eukprot:gb/GECG01000236.1/.p1 GENE.gb/GECG01000236.1/~~gb/GECG01000236.1/.p1  ORF type:complete len:866 (+),score=69.64 gb/GECG01000236.1/:1-2598(+)